MSTHEWVIRPDGDGWYLRTMDGWTLTIDASMGNDMIVYAWRLGSDYDYDSGDEAKATALAVLQQAKARDAQPGRYQKQEKQRMPDSTQPEPNAAPTDHIAAWKAVAEAASVLDHAYRAWREPPPDTDDADIEPLRQAIYRGTDGVQAALAAARAAGALLSERVQR